MAECKYEGCNGKVFDNSYYCILHVDVPEDENSAEFKRINELKNKEVQERINKMEINLEGAKLLELNIINKEATELNLNHAIIKKNLVICKSEFRKHILCIGITLGTNEEYGSISLREVKSEFLSFQNAQITHDVFFSYVKTSELMFNNAKIGRNLYFTDVIIKSFSLFSETEFKGLLNFYACDMGEKIGFENCKFYEAESQEEACRTAKNVCEKQGNKEEADYYYYLEMEAKRLQKPFYIMYPECILQKFFGYGIYPLRIVCTFFGLFIAFSLIFWYINGIFIDNSFNYHNLLNLNWNYLNLLTSLKLSFLTLIIPAYGLVKQSPVNYGFWIIFEAIIGAFMWPLFIASFARKYMR
jgi:hypothetical protein